MDILVKTSYDISFIHYKYYKKKIIIIIRQKVLKKVKFLTLFKKIYLF